jgi:hypothetical protein
MDNTASIHPSRWFTSTSVPSGSTVMTHSTNTRIQPTLSHIQKNLQKFATTSLILSLLPAEDHHYVSNNLERLLRRNPSVRRRWVQRVRTAGHNMLKHGKSQLTIRIFFSAATPVDLELTQRHNTTPMQDDPSTPTSAPILKNIERTPGRPPDTAKATCHLQEW